MWRALVLTILVGCGGPSQQQLAETPSATTRSRQVEAPPASTSDRDRERAVQQFDDMETTQRAYREAGQANRAGQPKTAPKKAGKGMTVGPLPPAPEQPKKKGPAEQAPPGATP